MVLYIEGRVCVDNVFSCSIAVLYVCYATIYLFSVFGGGVDGCADSALVGLGLDGLTVAQRRTQPPYVSCALMDAVQAMMGEQRDCFSCWLSR